MKSLRYFVALLFLIPGAAYSQLQVEYTGRGGTCTDISSCVALEAAYREVPANSGGVALENCQDQGTSNYQQVSGGAWRINAVTSCFRVDNGAMSNQSSGYVSGVIPAECNQGSSPPSCPSECLDPAGTSDTFHGQGAEPPSGICVNGCNYDRQGVGVTIAGYWLMDYASTGEGCSAGRSDYTTQDTDVNCVSVDGTQYCVDTNSSQNCGTVNGEYVCLDSVPEGNCLFTPQGQAICDSGSQENDPDTTVTDGDGNGYDVYGDGNTGGTAGGSGGGFGSSDANGNGQGDEMTGEDGEGECPSWENCDETHSGQTPELADDGCDFNCISSNFYNSISSGPLMSTVSSYAWSSGASSCPAPSMVLFGTTIVFDMHCTIGNDVAAVMSAVFLGLWLLIAVRIFLSA